jgi:cell wall-associated NlpC family hydrolase
LAASPGRSEAVVTGATAALRWRSSFADAFEDRGGKSVRSKALLVLACALAGALASARPALAAYSDVPASAWYAPAVRYVSETHDWMRGSADKFRPADFVTRAEFARAVVAAFAPGEQPDPKITFADVSATDAAYASANVAVKLKWLGAIGGKFLPNETVTRRSLDRAIVPAIGLAAEMRGLGRIATADAKPIPHASDFAPLVLGGELRLHYNNPSPDDALDLTPASPARRADAAFALYQADRARASSMMTALKVYRTVTIPVLTAAARQAVEFAVRYVGFPYVYAGEWRAATNRTSAYCCGSQTQGGFDCSGWLWWVLKAPDSGYDNTAARGYAGWPLAERSSYNMAKAAPKRIAYANAQPLDLMFFDTDSSASDGTDWNSVDHVGMYLGNGWMMHSSGNRGGVVVEAIGVKWWQEHFRWARRIVV